MDDQVPAIKGSAAQLSALAGEAARRSRAFDGDAVQAAIAVHLVALSEGSMIGAATHGMAHRAFHIVAESVVETEAHRVIASDSHE